MGFYSDLADCIQLVKLINLFSIFIIITIIFYVIEKFDDLMNGMEQENSRD